MPEIEITPSVDVETLIHLLRENDCVTLRCPQYTLVATVKDTRPCAGSSTFSEFKWGRDKNLQRYVSAGDFSSPWLIRIQQPGSNYDWAWTGGETMELKGESGGGRIVNCFVVGEEIG